MPILCLKISKTPKIYKKLKKGRNKRVFNYENVILINFEIMQESKVYMP